MNLLMISGPMGMKMLTKMTPMPLLLMLMLSVTIIRVTAVVGSQVMEPTAGMLMLMTMTTSTMKMTSTS